MWNDIPSGVIARGITHIALRTFSGERQDHQDLTANAV
jgi:hypothetical protein